MTEPNLIEISAIAFSAVMVLLTLLALMTQAILWLFPYTAKGSESSNKSASSGSSLALDQENRSAEIAAIQSAVQTLAPGWRVSQLELLDAETDSRPLK
jgi:hypothetical protein